MIKKQVALKFLLLVYKNGEGEGDISRLKLHVFVYII